MVMLKTAVAAIAPWGPRTPNRTFYKKIIMQIFAYYFLVDPKLLSTLNITYCNQITYTITEPTNLDNLSRLLCTRPS